MGQNVESGGAKIPGGGVYSFIPEFPPQLTAVWHGITVIVPGTGGCRTRSSKTKKKVPTNWIPVSTFIIICDIIVIL
jgi:hypothetical protein